MTFFFDSCTHFVNLWSIPYLMIDILILCILYCQELTPAQVLWEAVCMSLSREPEETKVMRKGNDGKEKHRNLCVRKSNDRRASTKRGWQSL